MGKDRFKGLKEKEVLALRNKFGENILPEKEKFSSFFIFLSQFKNPLVYILVLVFFVSLLLGESTNAILIITVIIINTIMGFSQEYSAQKTLQALKKILKHRAVVVRDGIRKEIEAKDLVPGDLVLLSSGDKVPADGKLIEGINLLVNEAVLTGEEEAIEKTLEEGNNLLFMGTTVLAGRGTVEITKTGTETEIGKIGESLAEIKKEQTPLQERLESLTHKLAYIVLVICLFIFLVGLWQGQEVLYMMKFSVILAVAAIPEGLPIVITVILALGTRRILKRNGLVKRLLSIETLGSASVICTDKTGTLTEGIMRVAKSDFKDKKLALYALTLNNNQKSALEVAVWEYIKKEGVFNPHEVFELTNRIYEEPFDSEKKYTVSVAKIEGKETAFITGAPEIILSFCGISSAEKESVLKKVDDWAGEGLRVLGIIFKEDGDLFLKEKFSFIGLIGIKDPVRQGAKEAIEEAQRAGIKIKIVTGDYRKTAERVAESIGFKILPENVMEGSELEVISDENLKSRIDDIVLFARTTPHQKIKIIRVLQEKGETVAMTGDGVNDALALKKADIGVVVGTGSDVAKEAGDLILLDNNFNTIVAACEEGRLIFSNIRKVVGYILSNSFAEIFLIFGSLLLGFPTPLTIVQILWIHLICDGPPDIMLGFEPKERTIMQDHPKELKKQNILPASMIFLIFTISFVVGFSSLGIFWHIYHKDGNLELARTIVFATLAIVSLVYIFAFKSLKKPIIRTENFFKNKYLLLSVIYGFALVFAAIYVPALNKLLGTVPLGLSHWLIVFGVAIVTTLLIDAKKLFNKKRIIKSV